MHIQDLGTSDVSSTDELVGGSRLVGGDVVSEVSKRTRQLPRKPRPTCHSEEQDEKKLVERRQNDCEQDVVDGRCGVDDKTILNRTLWIEDVVWTPDFHFRHTLCFYYER